MDKPPEVDLLTGRELPPTTTARHNELASSESEESSLGEPFIWFSRDVALVARKRLGESYPSCSLLTKAIFEEPIFRNVYNR
jgi:hypothetical protein